MIDLLFERPVIFWAGLPIAAVLLFLFARAQRRAGHSIRRTAALTGLRAGSLLLLLFLAARPIRLNDPDDEPIRERVVLLIDRSQSMSLIDDGESRYHATVDYVREQLAPALHAANLEVAAFLFAEDAVPADGPAIAAASPNGSRTDLAGAIVQTVQTDSPPLALVVLSDGVTTEHADTSRAVSALVERRVPLVGIGFGREQGSRTLSLQQVVAPSVAPPEQEFRVSASLQATGDADLPAFEVLLLRDGRLHQRKTVPAGTGARVWLESFALTESKPGSHRYTVRLLPPTDPALHCPDVEETVGVRVTDEKDLRVLFVQGGLTWDFKFVQLALRQDPTIKLTGLSRTSSQAMFFQNLGGDGHLPGGFPETIEELAKFRVVVLANLKPTDLTPERQSLLADFCREYGGGVLMIGGPETFNAAWQHSRLEDLLPVRFAPFSGSGDGQPFRLALTAEAARHAVFQVASGGENFRAWAGVPPFRDFAIVESVKPAARVWAVHPHQTGPQGPRTLMAVQKYGSGWSAVLCVQNFWKWRLAKESQPEHFDRFWQQLLRFLAEGSSETVLIRLADQQLRPDVPLQVVLEQRPDAALPADATRTITLQLSLDNRMTHQQTVELSRSRPVEVSCPLGEAGVYTLTVLDPAGVVQATRTVEIADPQWEFLRTGRDLDNLRQWARLSQGTAWPIEDCPNANELVRSLRQQSREAFAHSVHTQPVGVNAGMLILLLGCLVGEFVLRRRWGLV